MSPDTAPMPGFEGSYGGADDRISDQAILECKICWTPYEPAEGDPFRQVEPGTPFRLLPEDWSCPTCDAPRHQFMVREDPGAEASKIAADIATRTKALVAEFTEIFHAKMRDVPLCNHSLHVQAVGFRQHEGRPIGVLIAPWFMNLIQLPAADEDWSDLAVGTKELIPFSSGEYEFIHNTREMVGGYKACSLFSPMADFNSQAQAVEVAEAIMVALFDPQTRVDADETDRAADIRATRETALTPEADAPKVELDPAPTRRALLTGGLAADGG